MIASVRMKKPKPGVYSAPLIAAAVYLLASLR